MILFVFISTYVIDIKSCHLAHRDVTHSIKDMSSDELLNAHDGVCGCIGCPDHWAQAGCLTCFSRLPLELNFWMKEVMRTSAVIRAWTPQVPVFISLFTSTSDYVVVVVVKDQERLVHLLYPNIEKPLPVWANSQKRHRTVLKVSGKN